MHLINSYKTILYANYYNTIFYVINNLRINSISNVLNL